MPERQVRLGASPASVAAARDFASACLRDWSCDELVDPTVLLVSEVVSNAVLHGAPPIELTVRSGNDRIRVEVEDASPSPPRIIQQQADQLVDPQVGGLGLVLVDSLARRWGHEPVPGDGKVVWFEIT